MNIESKNFIVRNLCVEDKDNIRKLEYSRPWAKGILTLADELKEITSSQKEKFDYFESLWTQYQKEKYFWIIECKSGMFCGDVQIDIDSENEAHLYIQLLDEADITGFGSELFETIVEKIAGMSGIRNFYVELWNDADKSKVVYTESGYDIKNGCLELCV